MTAAGLQMLAGVLAMIASASGPRSPAAEVIRWALVIFVLGCFLWGASQVLGSRRR